MSIHRLIEQIKDKEIVQEVDGFYYWFPYLHTSGGFDAHALRVIANYLDEKNADITKALENLK